MTTNNTSYEEIINLSNVVLKVTKFCVILLEQIDFLNNSDEEIKKYSEQILIPSVVCWED